MATTAASSLPAILYAAAADRAVPAGHLRPAGRFLQCTSASASSATTATSAELPATIEHVTAKHSELPTKRHTEPILADTDGPAADRYASATNATTATATTDGSSTDRYATTTAAAAAIPTIRTTTATATISIQPASIRQILHPRSIQLPSACTPATASVPS